MFEQKEKTQPQIHHVYMKKNHYLLKGLGALLLLPFLPTLALGYGAYKGSKWGWNKNKKATVGVWLGALMIIGVSGIGKQEVKPTAIEPAKQEVKVEKRVEVPPKKDNLDSTTLDDQGKVIVEIVLGMTANLPSGSGLEFLDNFDRLSPKEKAGMVLGIASIGCGYSSGSDLPNEIVQAAKTTMKQVGCERAIKELKVRENV